MHGSHLRSGHFYCLTKVTNMSTALRQQSIALHRQTASWRDHAVEVMYVCIEGGCCLCKYAVTRSNNNTNKMTVWGCQRVADIHTYVYIWSSETLKRCKVVSLRASQKEMTANDIGFFRVAWKQTETLWKFEAAANFQHNFRFPFG